MNKFTLRPYQKQAISETEAMISMGSINIILEASTGWGKTSYISGLCQLYNYENIVIMVNIEPLINQISETLTLMNIDHSILKAGREKDFDESKNIQIVMSQTFYSRYEKLNIKADKLIIDERHVEYDTPRTRHLIDTLKPNAIIACTATPYDSNGYALKNAEVISTASSNDLTDQGYLSPLKYYVPKWSELVDYSKVKKTGGDYNVAALDEVIGSDMHIEQVIQSMNQLKAKNKKTLVFCSTIEICNKITDALKKEKYNVSAYHSKNSKVDNERIMTSFKHNLPYVGSEAETDTQDLFKESTSHNPITTIVSVNKLAVGFDTPDIDLGVMIRKSLRKSIGVQSVGRIKRTSNSLDKLLEKLKENNES